MALYELWNSLGVKPEAIIGHSIGEVAAGYASGALSLEDATKIVYFRSKCQTVLEGKGKMLAVGLSADEIKPELNEYINIAAINGPKSLTLSGDADALEELSQKLTNKDIFNTFLRVNVPFHSFFTESIKDEFLSSLEKVNTKKNSITLYSTVEGDEIDGTELDSDYWYKNIRQTVEFYPAISKMIKAGYDTFIELSPHPILATGINDTFSKEELEGLSLPSLRRKEDEELVFFDSLAKLIISGNKIDFKKLLGEDSNFVDLPYYAWQRERYWIESEESRRERIGKFIHPHLMGWKQSVKDPNDQIWEISLNKQTEPYINDHRVQGPMVYPAAGHLDLAMSIAKLSFGKDFGFIEDVHFENALLLPEDGTAEVQFEVSSDSGNFALYLRSRDSNSQWKRCSYGKINHCQDEFTSTPIDIQAIKTRLAKENVIEKEQLYNLDIGEGVQLGDAFRVVNRCFYNQREALTEIHVNKFIQSNYNKFTFHPVLFDGCIHAMLLIFQGLIAFDTAVFLPTFFNKIKINLDVAIFDKIWSYAQIINYDKEKVCFYYWIFNDKNELIMEIKDGMASSIEGTRKKEKTLEDYFYNYQWQINNIEETPTSASHGNWMVLENNTTISKRIKEKLNGRDYCSFVNSIKEFSNSLNVEKIIYLYGLDENNELNSSMLVSNQSQTGKDLITMMNILNNQNLSPKIYIVTNGVEQVIGDQKKTSPISAPIWGMIRVAMNEFPNIKIKLIDLSFSPSENEIGNLLKEIELDEGEEVSLRGKDRFIHVLEKSEPEILLERSKKKVNALGHPFNTVLGSNKVLDSIMLREFNKKEPEDDEVEIKVYASSLNFRDIMLGMGMLNDEAIEGGLFGKNLGLECSGEVTRVGINVKDFKEGDKVIALSSNSLSGITYAKECYVVKKPEHFTFEEAATILTVYLTSYYSLNYLCRLKKGDRVLVHAGAGGVGIAAIRLAQVFGAEVFATVGSEEKRKYLKNIGVDHVFNSRDLRFKDEIMKITQGKGIDIVINSIAGKAITQSINCLAPFGRFVEIGKRDIYENKRIELKPFGNNLAYFAVDVDRLLKQKPEFSKELIREFMQLFYDKKLFPHPYEKFSVSNVKDAFLFLSQSKQIGKVVVSMEGEIEVLPSKEIRFKQNAAYLVTGGCGGFGIHIAYHMAERGAGTIVLMGRSGVKGKEEEILVQKMQNLGTQVIIAKGDVTKELDVLRTVNDLENKKIPLKGIIHAATIFDDATILNLDEDRYMNVVIPKMLGAWNLHKATLNCDLDYFVMFSSISAVYGNPGQANYCAGNIFLDKFAYYRRSLGLPANTINWGVIGEAGFVSKNEKVHDILKSQGWTAFTLQEADKIFDRILLDNPIQQIAIDVDWTKVGEFFPNNKNSERFGSLIKDDLEGNGSHSKNKDSIKYLLQNVPLEDQKAMLSDELKRVIARILGTDENKVELDTPISNMGIDSLMATQLNIWIRRIWR